jgi:hypothetical protein
MPSSPVQAPSPTLLGASSTCHESPQTQPGIVDYSAQHQLVTLVIIGQERIEWKGREGKRENRYREFNGALLWPKLVSILLRSLGITSPV